VTTTVEREPQAAQDPSLPWWRVGKKTRRRLAKLLGFADIPLGTVAAFVPPAVAIQEVKEVIQESLDL
jgi:hypothetical protein